MTVGADSGAHEGGGHAEECGVVNKAGVLKMLV